MEHPVREIGPVVKTLTEGSPAEQEHILKTFFLPEAAFTHPFCRVPSISTRNVPIVNYQVNSRWLMLMIYRWYRILSPHIDLEIDSTVQDQKKSILYLQIRQTFTFFFLPFYHANVSLVTVLHLEKRPTSSDGSPLPLPLPLPATDRAASQRHGNGNGAAVAATDAVPQRQQQARSRFFVASQEDLYQTNEFLKFVAPFFGAPILMLWQLFATLLCVIGALALAPFSWLRVRVGAGANSAGDVRGEVKTEVKDE